MRECQELLPKLSEILEQSQPPEKEANSPTVEAGTAKAQFKAEREWYGAIAALEKLLLQHIDPASPDSCEGLILCGPAPVIAQRSLLQHFHAGVFTPKAFKSANLCQFQLPAAEAIAPEPTRELAEYPLFPIDPLASEQFCLVLTANFGVVLVLGENAAIAPTFQFSFDPDILHQVWNALRSRLRLTSRDRIQHLDILVRQFAPSAPSYRLISQFTRQLLDHLPDVPTIVEKRTATLKHSPPQEDNVLQLANFTSSSLNNSQEQLLELELLQALTHEVRTPLTTIRMLTRLLLKKHKNLAADVIQRLKIIDRECTEQIERMELIFRAAELETTPVQPEQVQLVPVPLEQLFQQCIPHWQHQAQRRNVALDIVLPEKLPTVASNPGMLDRVLTGLLESFTRSLPAGARVRVQVTTAGHQLKLQLLACGEAPTHSLKSMGQLLMFQPETGNLSLNLDATKNLIHALGGKLIVRQRPHQGEEVTIFLPVGNKPAKLVNTTKNPVTPLESVGKKDRKL